MKKVTKLVHWPAQDVPCCEEHASQLQIVGEAMGSPVSVSDIDGAGLECTNCKREES